MAFVDKSTVTSSVINQGAEAVAAAQQTVSTSLPTIPKSVSQTVSTVVQGGRNAVGSVESLAKNGGVGKTLERVALNVAGGFLQAALKSVSGTFGASAKGLASGISPSLSKIFDDTSTKAGSAVTTQTPDPVSSNLLTQKPPLSSTFKVGSAVAGSQEVGMTGSISKNGSGASLMTGVGLSTLLNRFDIDSTLNILSSVVGGQQKNILGGLFGSLGGSSPSIIGINGAAQNQLSTSSLLNFNDLNSFLGKVAPLEAVTGKSDFSKFFITNSEFSLLDDQNQYVSTNGSNVDAQTANSLLEILKAVGCSITTSQYNSVFERDSIYNLGLNTAALNGMTREIQDLLGCNQASSVNGQRSISGAFVAVSGSQLGTASTILDSVENPASLNTDFINKSIVTNPNLKSVDVSLAKSVLGKIGSSPEKAMSIDSVSTAQYPVYDASVVRRVPVSFTDSLMGDQTLSSLLGGSSVTMNNDGTFNFG